MLQKRIIASFLCFISITLFAQEVKMVSIKEGVFVPLYGATNKKPVKVNSFTIDVFQVTNAQY